MPSEQRENREPIAVESIAGEAAASDLAPLTDARARQQQSGSASHQLQSGLVIALPTERTERRDGADEEASRCDRMLDRRTQAALGQQLRTYFNDIASAPLPDRLLHLLQQLESTSRESGS